MPLFKRCCDGTGSGCCVAHDDLPDVTINGETLSIANAGDWDAISGCCYKTREVVIDGTWTEVKSALIAYDEREAEAFHDVYVRDNIAVTVPGTFAYPTVAEDASSLEINGVTVNACDTASYLCNTLHEVNHEREERFLMARWRKKSIDLYLFKAMAQTADDVEPVCRWFVVSRLNVEYQAAHVTTLFEHRKTSAGLDDCCVATGLYEVDRTAATDAELFALLAAGTIGTTSSFSVYSAKTFLTAPTGVQTFAAGTALTATFAATPCISVSSTTSTGTVASADNGRYPVSWTAPTITNSSIFAGQCPVKITFADGPGCVQGFLESGVRDIDFVSAVPQLSPEPLPISPYLLQQLAIIYSSSVPSTRIDQVCTILCGDFLWEVKTIMKSKVRDLTSSRTFQNYTARSIVIAPSSWTATF